MDANTDATSTTDEARALRAKIVEAQTRRVQVLQIVSGPDQVEVLPAPADAAKTRAALEAFGYRIRARGPWLIVSAHQFGA